MADANSKILDMKKIKGMLEHLCQNICKSVKGIIGECKEKHSSSKSANKARSKTHAADKESEKSHKK